MYMLVGVVVATVFTGTLQKMIDIPQSELEAEEAFYQREVRIYLNALGGWNKLYPFLILSWPLVLIVIWKMRKEKDN